MGAEKALTATYKKPGSPQLTHNLLDMPSPDEANKLRQQQVQKQLGESGLRVTSEEPVEDDDGNQLGMATVLEGKTRGSTGTAVLWTDEDLYCEAITEGDDAEAFYEDADC